jgi:hypothetical protein
MRRLLAFVGQFAGPLLLVAVSSSCGFVIGALMARPNY